jgi:hypothetical protein
MNYRRSTCSRSRAAARVPSPCSGNGHTVLYSDVTARNAYRLFMTNVTCLGDIEQTIDCTYAGQRQLRRPSGTLVVVVDRFSSDVLRYTNDDGCSADKPRTLSAKREGSAGGGIGKWSTRDPRRAFRRLRAWTRRHSSIRRLRNGRRRTTDSRALVNSNPALISSFSPACLHLSVRPVVRPSGDRWRA